MCSKVTECLGVCGVLADLLPQNDVDVRSENIHTRQFDWKQAGDKLRVRIFDSCENISCSAIFDKGIIRRCGPQETVPSQKMIFPVSTF